MHENVGLWYQSNINCPFLLMMDTFKKLSEVPPISIVNFSLGWNALKLLSNSLMYVRVQP